MCHLLPTAGGFTATNATSQAGVAVLRCATARSCGASRNDRNFSGSGTLRVHRRLPDRRPARRWPRPPRRCCWPTWPRCARPAARAPAARIAADHAVAVYPGADATLLADGRRAGAVGAAFANGVLANVLDFDDGHRLTKGHPGAVVIPGALAVAQLVDATPTQLLEAVVVGYEVSIRAGHRPARSRSRLPRLRCVGRASASPRRAPACSASIRARPCPRSVSPSTTRRSPR